MQDPRIPTAAVEARESDDRADLFRIDPLLSDPENARKYQEMLNRHLIERAGTYDAKELHVNIFDWEARQVFEQERFPRSALTLSSSLVQTYINAVCHRDTITDDDLKIVQKHTIACDPQRTSDRYTPHVVPRFDSDIQTENCIRIAAISYHIGVSKYTNKNHFFEHLAVCDANNFPSLRKARGASYALERVGRTRLTDQKLGTAWRNEVKELLKTALMRRPHVVCLPEFSLPPSPNELQHTEDDIVSEFHQMILNASQIDSCLVFGGSRHEYVYNRGPVFQKQGKVVADPFWHYKIASSRNLGENILGARGASLPIYELEYVADGHQRRLHVTVAICFDAFDPAMFLTLVKNSNLSEQPIPVSSKNERSSRGEKTRDRNLNIPTNRLILVPSFNPSRIFVDALRDLSYRAECMVLYVNAVHGDATLFLDGFRIWDLMQSEELISQVEHVFDSEFPDDQQLEFDFWEPSKRESVLEILIKGLKAIPRDQMKHLVMVEQCRFDTCKSNPASSQSSCNHDILYFNIPVSLIQTIEFYRRANFPRENVQEMAKSSADGRTN